MNEKQQVIFNLDLLRRYLENFNPGFFCNAINHKAFVEDLKKAGEMLQADQWIPVSERMPKEDDEVLAFDGVECSVMALVNKDKTDVWHWDGSYCMEWQNSNGTNHADICDVTHWMPLPEPPEVHQP